MCYVIPSCGTFWKLSKVPSLRQAHREQVLLPAADPLRFLTRERAIALGKMSGVDILRVLGEPFIDLWLTRLVNRAKSSTEPGGYPVSNFR